MSVIFSDGFPAILDGTNWAQQAGSWAWQTPSYVRCTSSGAPGLLRTTTTAHAALADCQVFVTQVAATGGDAGPFARGTSGAGNGNTCYYLDVDGSNASVFRRITGTDTLLGSADAITVAAQAVKSIKVVGTGGTVTISKYYKGVQVSSDISDTNAARIVTAGQTGIVNWSTNVGTGDTDFDTYSVDDLVSARQWILTR